MPWRGHNGGFCHGCDRSTAECGRLSNRYKCAECGEREMLAEHHQLRISSGPHFEHWRKRCRAAFGVPEPAEAPE